MPPETLNVLLGAGIALVAGLLTSITAFIFQNHSENKKRNWEMEDLKIKELMGVIYRRIDLIEEMVITSMKWSADVLNRLDKFVYVSVSLSEYVADIAPLANCAYIQPMAKILADNELNDLLDKYDEELGNVLMTLASSTGLPNEALNEALTVEKLIAGLKKANEYYEKVILRLDIVRLNKLNTFY